MSRGHKILITKEQAAELFVNQGRKCAISGVDLVLKADADEITASLDWIDSDGDYKLGNVQWIHKEINKMKNDLSEEKFFGWIKKIYLNKNIK